MTPDMLVPLRASAISAGPLPDRAITGWNGRKRMRLAEILDLFGEDSWRINVYAGEREVRPPGAPTTHSKRDQRNGEARHMDVRRLRPVDARLGVDTIRRLKAPEGYPEPSESYFEGFLARPENVFIVASDEAEPIGARQTRPHASTR